MSAFICKCGTPIGRYDRVCRECLAAELLRAERVRVERFADLVVAANRPTTCGCPEEHPTLEAWEAVHGAWDAYLCPECRVNALPAGALVCDACSARDLSPSRRASPESAGDSGRPEPEPLLSQARVASLSPLDPR